jgi:hypothetical protein
MIALLDVDAILVGIGLFAVGGTIAWARRRVRAISR